MENNGSNDSYDAKGTLFLFGGLALLVVGAGFIVSHPAIRKLLGQAGGVGNLVEAAVPDIERYLKLRSM
jgi:hypothetical protein